MHLLAVLLTTNAALIDTLENSRLDLSANILKNARAGDHRMTRVGFHPNRHDESFAEFLGEHLGLVDNRPSSENHFDGVVVLFSHDVEAHIAGIRDGIFASAFDENVFIENRDNFLVRSFGRLTKNLLVLMETMRDKTWMEAAVLPSHNFNSRVFRDFLRFCQDKAQEPDFANLVNSALAKVTKLRGPRRRSKFPAKYFRDDRDVCFQYGHEAHSMFETGADHGPSCSIRGIFRFGVPLEQQRHFNVVSRDDGTPISGSYGNCHGAIVTFARRTHVNMFSNDFFK